MLSSTLQLVVDRLAEAQPGAMVFLTLYNAPGDSVAVAAYRGLPPTSRIPPRFPSSDSVAYATMARRAPVFYRDVLAQKEFSSRMAKVWGYRSILCVPLPLDSPRYAITILRPTVHDFTESEVAYAQAIANQAAVAIHNAQLYERQVGFVRELFAVKALLERERVEIQALVSMREALTRPFLEGKGLSGIARALADSLGRTVVVEDQFFDILVTTNPGPLGDPVAWPPEEQVGIPAGERDRVAERWGSAPRSTKAAFVREEGTEGQPSGRLMCPIVGDGKVMGYLSVLGWDAEPEPRVIAAVEHAAQIASAEFTKQRAVLEAEMRVKATYLEELMALEDEETFFRRAGALRFDFRREFTVLATLLIADSDGLSSLSLIDRAIEPLSAQRLVVRMDDFVLALVSPRHGESTRYAMRFADAIRQEATRRLRTTTLLVAVGPTCRAWSELRQATGEARRTLAAMRRMPVRAPLANREQLGLFAILSDTPTDEIQRFCEGMLGALQSRDKSKGTDLLVTLRAYLDSNGNARGTARQLSVHVNTIHHRLATIERLTGCVIEDAETRLNFQLAFRLIGPS